MPNWNDVLAEVQAELNSGHGDAHDRVRRKYLRALHEFTGRNIIAMYSGWLSKPEVMSAITDEDTNGLMTAIHQLDRSKGLDLILHTPGGEIAAAHSIVNYLREMFGSDVRAIVPQIAMSAGTMIACCCREILLAKHSSLGPIDPQVRGVPANMVIMEFDRAVQEVKDDPARMPVWHSILSQYRPTFLTQCDLAQRWSSEFVKSQLVQVMFANDDGAETKADAIVEKLSKAEITHLHSRHINHQECRDLGLKISMVEDDPQLQDLVLTVHHCYMHTLSNGPAYKAIENHEGRGLFKLMQAAQMQFPVFQQPPKS